TSRSQHQQQRGVIPRPSSGKSNSRTRERGVPTTCISASVPMPQKSGGGTAARSARSTLQVGVQTSARPSESVTSMSPSRQARGLQQQRSGPGKEKLSARITSRSLASGADSFTDYSTDTPRETGRTTTTMAMSTARAEATLSMLEAERAQLEHRLKKVEDELRQEHILSMEENRRRGRPRGAPPPSAR
ncbi:unnamed protein product, partial [Hapterophycus canaliculatus]